MVHCTWRKHRLLLIGTALLDTMLHELDPAGYPLDLNTYDLNLVRIFRRPNEDAGSALERLRMLEEPLDPCTTAPSATSRP